MPDNNANPAAAAAISSGPNSDYLIRGSDYLAKYPGFKAVGRDAEMKEVSNILMRKNGNNVLLTGMAGVGVSTVTMGLQASKDDLNSPADIVGKRFYWLDTDALFASGDSNAVNQGFQKALQTLSRAPDTVLVIDDFKDFLDGCRNTGSNNIINALMRELRFNSSFQAIFETRDTDLGDALKCHSDMKDIFTLMEIKEPERDPLNQMVHQAALGLSAHHKIKISEDAIKTALDLTGKFFIKELDSAQPNRVLMLLEGALTELRNSAHTHPLARDAVEENLADVAAALAGKPGPALKDKSQAELQAMKLVDEQDIARINADWDAAQKKLRKLYGDQRAAEEEIRVLNDKIEAQDKAEEAARKQHEADQTSGKQSDAKTSTNALRFTMTAAGFKTADGQSLTDQRAQWEKLARDNKTQFDALLDQINQGVELKSEHVLQEFSRLSGVPVSRLSEDETTKLMKLEDNLKDRIFGQDEPISAVAKAVRRGRTGLKKPNKPIGSFLFLGPSGVGKTELAKALAQQLFGDESSLKVYNMSEYQEKHAVSTLIGAPPGYEGYADGGLLTNNMRQKPYVVNVFDEIEKGHKDIYDLFLQILDEGKLNDRRGLTASFANAINIMTSNIGAQYFLDETLTFDQAKEKALKDLWNSNTDTGGSGYRPEFLNRFDGIFCFNRLGEPEIIKICDKNFKEINGWLADKGIHIEMDQADKEAMCKTKAPDGSGGEYEPRGGARSIQKFIQNEITSRASDEVLMHPEEHGAIKVHYDLAKKAVTTELVPDQPAPANQNAPAPGTAAKAAGAVFKASK